MTLGNITRHLLSYLTAAAILCVYYGILGLSILISVTIPPTAVGATLWLLDRSGATFYENGGGRVFLLTLALGLIGAEINIVRAYLRASFFSLRYPRNKDDGCEGPQSLLHHLNGLIGEIDTSGKPLASFGAIWLSPSAEVGTFKEKRHAKLVLGWVLLTRLPTAYLRPILTHEAAHHHRASMAVNTAMWRLHESCRRLRSTLELTQERRAMSPIGDHFEQAEKTMNVYQLLAFAIPFMTLFTFRFVAMAMLAPRDHFIEFYCDRQAASRHGGAATARAILAVARLSFDWKLFVDSLPDVNEPHSMFDKFDSFRRCNEYTQAEKEDFSRFLVQESITHPSIQARIIALYPEPVVLESGNPQDTSHLDVSGLPAGGASLHDKSIEAHLSKIVAARIHRAIDTDARRSKVLSAAVALGLIGSTDERTEAKTNAINMLGYLLEYHCGKESDWRSTFDKKLASLHSTSGPATEMFGIESQVLLLLLEHIRLELNGRKNVGDTRQRIRVLEALLMVADHIKKIKNRRTICDTKRVGDILFNLFYQIGISVPKFYFATPSTLQKGGTHP